MKVFFSSLFGLRAFGLDFFGGKGHCCEQFLPETASAKVADHHSLPLQSKSRLHGKVWKLPLPRRHTFPFSRIFGGGGRGRERNKLWPLSLLPPHSSPGLVSNAISRGDEGGGEIAPATTTTTKPPISWAAVSWDGYHLFPKNIFKHLTSMFWEFLKLLCFDHRFCFLNVVKSQYVL